MIVGVYNVDEFLIFNLQEMHLYFFFRRRELKKKILLLRRFLLSLLHSLTDIIKARSFFNFFFIILHSVSLLKNFLNYKLTY